MPLSKKENSGARKSGKRNPVVEKKEVELLTLQMPTGKCLIRDYRR